MSSRPYEWPTCEACGIRGVSATGRYPRLCDPCQPPRPLHDEDQGDECQCRDCEDSRAERTWELRLAKFHGGDQPQTISERMTAAYAEKGRGQ